MEPKNDEIGSGPVSDDPSPVDSGLGPSPSQKRLIGRGKPVWVMAVAGCYVLAFVAMVGCMLFSTLSGHESATTATVAIAIVAIMLTSQAALLLIPIRVLSRRPVRRSSIWFPIIMSGLLFGAIVWAGGIALWELLTDATFDNIEHLLFLALGVLSWVVWAVVFYKMSGRRAPGEVGFRLHKKLYQGSVLELLIALPAHAVVRERTECSAGVGTFLGICAGVAAMLIAFGPSVLILFAKRCMEITPPVYDTRSPARKRRRLRLWTILTVGVIVLLIALLLTGPLFP